MIHISFLDNTFIGATMQRLRELEAARSEDEDLLIIPKESEVKEEVPLNCEFKEITDWVKNSKVTRKIENLILHCTATKQDAKVSSIINYWKKNLGWKNPGYHILVTSEGECSILSELNNVTNGAKGYNHNSIHLSYIGGIDNKQKSVDNRTEKQLEAFEILIKAIVEKYPNINIIGHNEISSKACPCFDVQEYVKNLDL